jgi:uncharacterized phage protein (TIGR01671 family)
MIPRHRAWVKTEKCFADYIESIRFYINEIDLCWGGICESDCFDFNDVILMQSTGLKDKNDKEIFEGDVLEIQGIKMIVKFGSYKYLETSKNNGHILGVLHDGLGFYVECINVADPDNISPFEPETLKNSQIIGNIYENKELLDA